MYLGIVQRAKIKRKHNIDKQELNCVFFVSVRVNMI